MTVERSQVGCRLWLQWILASTIGLLVGFVMGNILDWIWIVTSPLDWNTSQDVGSFIGFGMTGAGSGFVQFLVLEQYIPQSGWWILATAAAWIMDLGFGVIGIEAMSPYVFGVLTGILQWLILRRHVSRAGLWVLASAVGWALGFASVRGAADGVRGEDAFTMGYFLAQAALVSSVITGGTLVWLLRQTAPEA